MLTSVNRTTLEIGPAFGSSALFICEAPPAGSTGSRRSAAVAANPAIPALLAEPEAGAGKKKSGDSLVSAKSRRRRVN
jgi:hypothetical protein